MKTRVPLRSMDIRKQNEKLVLHLIRSHPNISQSEVVNITGLKPPTVYRIFSLLEERGLIQVADEQPVSGERKGRRPLPYRVVAGAHYMVGVDFWARTAAVALFDFRGQIIHRKESSFASETTAEEACDELGRLIEEALTSARVTKRKLLGIGIGAPGVVDVEKGTVVVYDRIEGMNDFDLKTRIGERFGVPVAIHNNCSVAALASYRYGQARGHDSLAVFLIRSGMGGAFIRKGQLYVNQNRTAFEVGNFLLSPTEHDKLVDEQGIIPYHGSLPPASDRTGRQSALDTTRTKLEDFVCEDTIFRTVSKATGVENWDKLDGLFRQSDQRVAESLESIGKLFSTAAHNVALLLNPEAIIIVSRYRSLSGFFRQALLSRLQVDQDLTRVNLAEVLAEEYDATLACRGASDLVLDTYLSIPH